jgi:hypothetical protein
MPRHLAGSSEYFRPEIGPALRPSTWAQNSHPPLPWVTRSRSLLSVQF